METVRSAVGVALWTLFGFLHVPFAFVYVLVCVNVYVLLLLIESFLVVVVDSFVASRKGIFTATTWRTTTSGGRR
jgi:hypothetical protein